MKHEHTIPMGSAMTDPREHIAHLAAEAASAPAVKASAIGTSIVGVGQWFSTGHGIATAIGLAITLASFLLQVWKLRQERADAARSQALDAREDARRQAEHEARMKTMEHER